MSEIVLVKLFIVLGDGHDYDIQYAYHYVLLYFFNRFSEGIFKF